MAARAKMIQWEQEVCTRLHNLNQTRKDAIAARKKQFEKRDAIDAEMEDLDKSEKVHMEELKAKWCDAVKQIGRLSKTINWANSEISETIDNAEQPELYGKDFEPKPPKAIFETKKVKENDDDIDDDSEAKVPEREKTKPLFKGRLAN